MTEKLNQTDPETTLVAIAIVLIVAFFLALIFTGAALYQRTAIEQSEDPDPAEIDPTYYPETGEDLYR